MNLNEVRTFLEVIETGSLVAASQRLNVTQSTVTARISALEEEVGQKLIHRYKSGAELTSAGFKFRRYAEVMVQLWRQARYEVSLPEGFEAACNVGLEFDLWQGIGQRFLDYVRIHAPGVVIALWPGEQRQIDRWLSIGLVDLAFCYVPQAGEDFTSRVLVDDELVMVSTGEGASAQPGAGYVFVDHGDEFRRRHAEAFAADVPASVTIASSEWAVDHLLRHGGSGYLPRRIAREQIALGRLHPVAGAPDFRRRVYVVENASTVRAWPWYGAALAALEQE
ncbi:MAG TPA: LysR family transcriptional regulator [Dongiaceae bacterium]|jgi:DNA-binding transcriptional LysR family regulator